MLYKLMLLLSTLSTSTLAASIETRSLSHDLAKQCMRSCEQQKAQEDDACHLSFKTCGAKACTTPCSDDAASCSDDCKSCDYSLALCLTDSESHLLACQINCTN